MSDIIYIKALRLDAVVGIFAWEQAIRQAVYVDIEMAADISKAAQCDDIKHTVNYKAVAKRLIAFAEQNRFKLVETMAEKLAHVIQEEFGVSWVRLTLNKQAALRGAQDVGVIIERGRRS